MNGRYGNDQLNQLLSIVSLIGLIIAIFTQWLPVYLLAIVLIVLCYFRMLSKNTHILPVNISDHIYLLTMFSSLLLGASCI